MYNGPGRDLRLRHGAEHVPELSRRHLLLGDGRHVVGDLLALSGRVGKHHCRGDQLVRLSALHCRPVLVEFWVHGLRGRIVRLLRGLLGPVGADGGLGRILCDGRWTELADRVRRGQV